MQVFILYYRMILVEKIYTGNYKKKERHEFKLPAS